jgi:hypothetical protein
MSFIYVSYIIAALLSCNFIIKNYVNRKITSYIYALIFTKSLWLNVKHFIALTKRESVRRIYFVITDQDYHIDQWPRKTRESMTLTLKSYAKWRSPLFGATCNFNDQILPYGILFLTFINTNVFYLPSFKLTY